MSDEQTGVEELDALRAAPGYHTLLFENESVRVLHTHVPAGESCRCTRIAGRRFCTSSAGAILCGAMRKGRW
jgi:hypothetical protein